MAAESKPNENGENAPKEEKDEPALVVEDKSGDVNPASDVVSGANTAQTPQASNSLIAEKATDSMQTDSKKETMAKEADDSQGDTKKLFKMWSHKSVEGLDSPSTEDVKPASDVASGAVTAQTPQKSNSSVAEKMTEPMKTDSKKETTAKEAGNSQGDTKNLFKMWSNKSVKGLDSSSTHVSSTRPPPGVPRRARSSITAPPAKEEPSPTATGATPPKPGSLDVVNGLEVRKLSVEPSACDRFHRHNVFTQFIHFLRHIWVKNCSNF